MSLQWNSEFGRARRSSRRKRCQRSISPQMRRMQIVALLMLVASGTVNYPDRFDLSIANIEVRQELGLSATAMGVLLSAFLMSFAFSQLPAGIPVDRVGPRILLGAELAIWSVAQGAVGFVTN